MTETSAERVARLGKELQYPVEVTLTAEEWGLLVADVAAALDVFGKEAISYDGALGRITQKIFEQVMEKTTIHRAAGEAKAVWGL